MSLFRCSDDGFEFRFTAQNGRCFRSVAIVNGAPEFRFDPSPNVPALTEADLADAFRLALEGRRPEFYYVPIPSTHPFFGRQYKQYIPEWLEGTSIGETLSQTDWAMKGLTHGLRSDDSKTEFWAWERTSQLKGLATASEFPKDKSGGSVIMSCESVRVRKSDSEMEFVGEPRLHINDECSSAYTRYINRVLPSVAYHDEPLFLKIGEILKLILAAEWLVAEKGVKISQRWLEEHSNRPKVLAVPFYKTELEGSALQAALEVGTPSRQDQLAVRRDNCSVPSRDVSMKKSEARHCCKSLEKKKQASVRYGYYDVGNGEMVQYEADGTPCVKVKSLKAYCERRICADGKIVETTQFRMKIPFKEAEGIKDLCGTTAGEFSEKVGSVSMDVKIGTCMPGEDMTMTVVAKDDCHPNAKIVSIVRATHDNYNLLYKGLDPKIPLRPKVPGVCEAIVPNAQSWNELYYNKTVPWPQVWRVPYDESASVSTAMGGVAARSIPVVEERRLIEQPARSHEGRTVVTGVRPPLLQGESDLDASDIMLVQILIMIALIFIQKSALLKYLTEKSYNALSVLGLRQHHSVLKSRQCFQ